MYGIGAFFLKTLLLLPLSTLYEQYSSKESFVLQDTHPSMVHMAAVELAEILPVGVLFKAHNALSSCAPIP